MTPEMQATLKTTRTETLHIRLTPELKSAIAQAADESGRTISNFVEYTLKKAVKTK